MTSIANMARAAELWVPDPKIIRARTRRLQEGGLFPKASGNFRPEAKADHLAWLILSLAAGTHHSAAAVADRFGALVSTTTKATAHAAISHWIQDIFDGHERASEYCLEIDVDQPTLTLHRRHDRQVFVPAELRVDLSFAPAIKRKVFVDGGIIRSIYNDMQDDQ